MPENKQIHDLPIAEQTSSSDLFETEIPSQLMQSGYASRKVSAAEIADLLLNDMTYPQALQTTAKKIIPAINEAAQSGGGGASVVQKTMAQYTALPSSEKMNGSIYKITDKALIYCLDEAYHALKEITSADYALLTNDEKNNGTLYILTDEETTADDIPYSSGVSVADKLDDINNRLLVAQELSQTLTTTNAGVIDSNNFWSGGISINDYYVIAKTTGGQTVCVSSYNNRYIFYVRFGDTWDLVKNTSVTLKLMVFNKP